jgi:hypothetical protein
VLLVQYQVTVSPTSEQHVRRMADGIAGSAYQLRESLESGWRCLEQRSQSPHSKCALKKSGRCQSTRGRRLCSHTIAKSEHKRESKGAGDKIRRHGRERVRNCPKVRRTRATNARQFADSDAHMRSRDATPRSLRRVFCAAMIDLSFDLPMDLRCCFLTSPPLLLCRPCYSYGPCSERLVLVVAEKRGELGTSLRSGRSC